MNLYSSKIFEQSGIDPKFGTWLVGVFNFIGAIIPMLIINSNKLYFLTCLECGRKILLTISFGVMFVSHIFIVYGNYNMLSGVR